MLVAARLLSRQDLGVYGAASRLLSALTIFLSAAAASLYLTRSLLAVRSAVARRAYRRHTVTLTTLLLLLVLGLIVPAPSLVGVFVGARYAAAAPIQTLIIGHVPLVLALPLAGLRYALDDSRSVFVARALCLAATIAANAALTQRLGMTGPGWAFGVGYLVYMAYLALAVSGRKGAPAVRAL